MKIYQAAALALLLLTTSTASAFDNPMSIAEAAMWHSTHMCLETAAPGRAPSEKELQVCGRWGLAFSSASTEQQKSLLKQATQMSKTTPFKQSEVIETQANLAEEDPPKCVLEPLNPNWCAKE